MTEDTDKELPDGQDADAANDKGPLAGERLATARREQQISVLEVAKELHLDEPKVRALEQNDFGMLGAPVFAKGHLRKYASMVNVDPDDVLQDYYQLTRSHGMPPVVGKVRKQAREYSPGPWIILFVVLIIAALAYWWFVARDTSPDVSASLPAAATVEDSTVSNNLVANAVDVAPPPITEQAPVEVEDAVVTEADDSVALAPAAAAVTPAPVAPTGELRLTMSFSGECWTEVTDANGRRLFFDLGRAGRNVNVSGEAPLSVLFGNANNVSVQVNGVDYEITAADRRGQTARFTVRNP